MHAYHFCKQSDTRRQDVGGITRSLAYQLAQHHPAVRAHLLALDAAVAERVQTDADFATTALLVEPLQALAAAGGHAVVLVDALDEADGESGANLVVRMLRVLGQEAKAGLSAIVTMRPAPAENVVILKFGWGGDNVLQLAPAELRAPAAASAAPALPPAVLEGVRDAT